MEVHHHPTVEKKNFKEYFLEFLMIFLAVTMGFFAENIREHYTEKANTKEYLETYRDELLQQQILYNTYKKIYQKKIIFCDSIRFIFFNGEENTKMDALKRLVTQGLTLVEIPINTSSYDQIVNSGALRYISDIGLRDSMSVYKGQIETIKNYNNRVLQGIINSTFEISKLQDFHDMVSADTSASYNLLAAHVPDIKPFEHLTGEQRNSIVYYYVAYIYQSQSDLRRIRNLYASNQNLVAMVNAQLEK